MNKMPTKSEPLKKENDVEVKPRSNSRAAEIVKSLEEVDDTLNAADSPIGEKPKMSLEDVQKRY